MPPRALPPCRSPRCTGRRRAVPALLLAAGLLATVPPAGAAAGASPAEAAEPAADPVQAKIARGYDLLERKLTDDALRAFREADELAGGGSAEALIGLARAYHGLGARSSAEKAARRAVNAAGDDPKLRFRAQETLRLVLSATAAAGSETEADLRPGNGAGYSMVTLEGRSLTPEHFAGRAVLLDFWGTWCPPCRQAAPALGRLARQLDGEPFELVGVSTDASRGDLEVFIEQHEMEWTQVWDRTGEVTREHFRVRAYPTYVLLDHEGREVFRITGWDEGIRRRLERKVHAAVRTAREAAAPAGG